MGSKRLSWISLVISIIALVVGVIALVNRCPTQDLYLHFDYMGVIVGILALLVTALIGAQVGQYVFVDRKIEKVSGKITRIISRKVAQEEASKKAESIAKETAENMAMEVVGGLPLDIAYVLRGKDMMNSASKEQMLSEFMTAIDYVVNALKEFKQCGAEPLYQSTVDDALDKLKNYFEWSNKRGGLRILKGKRGAYEEVMKDLRSEKLQVCMDYLRQAKELDKDEDNKISLSEFKI